jgi:hypothetical protein
VIVVTKNFFLRGQANMKLRGRQLGHLNVEEQIGRHNYTLKLTLTLRSRKMFHVNNVRPRSSTSLRPNVPVTTP